MKLSDIGHLLADAAGPGEFRAANAANIEERRAQVTKRGSVVPVHLTEDADLELSSRDVAKLCNLFIAGNLDAVELAYVADALQLSDRVTWSEEGVADYIAEFTDPEVNGAFTIERAKVIVREIEQHT